MGKTTIMALILDKRTSEAVKVQEILTKHGCIIKMRIGLHEAGSLCSEEGLILLHLAGKKKEISDLARDLGKIKGVKTKSMEVA
jgi:metal-responsive CopG/Arc/MetJ family transcriptional regulator